jgi:hypothetical protein
LSSPATTDGNTAFLTPRSEPSVCGVDQVEPWSWLTATAGRPSEPTYPKYTVPLDPTPTDGSASLGLLPGTLFSVHDVPPSVLTTTAALLPQALLGRYAVPSGATLTWPCRPPQSSRL